MPADPASHGTVHARPLTRFAALLFSLLACGAAFAATLLAPQQLTVTSANALGGSVYNLALNTTPRSALISATQALNTDGSRHGAFDALVWLPNPASGSLDLVVADATRGQILRYAGPSYGTSSVIFTYAGKGSGPAYPTGLAVDGAGNLFVISPSSKLLASPMVWVLPFKSATGAYGAPVLVDQSFSGVRTLALADVLVAPTAATAIGSAVPAWKAGDILVLVGDTFNSRLVVYSKSAIANLLANPRTPLSGPTSTVITSKQFLSQIAAPFGFDIWPNDATHGISVLFTTIDGRIIRFDTRTGNFTSNFASGLGLGLQKLKVGTFAGTPYAFVAQLTLPAKGQILQFGAPPASGANRPLATVSKNVSDPIGVAVMSSGTTPVSSCVAPQTCSPTGPAVTTQISGPGASRIPPGATILEETCTIPADPRVAVVNGVWSCLGPTINVCGANPAPGCVPATLDVANYCPGFPNTILPPSMCGHSGANGASLQVIKATAPLLDSNANNIFIQTGVDATLALPGPYDLGCQTGNGQFGPIVAWAPRSDLRPFEGNIVEDQSSPYFVDFTGYCDRSGTNTHVESMFAIGLGLNASASGLGSGSNGGLFGFITTKFNNLQTMLQHASPQITPQTVTVTLQNYATQSQTYFNSDYSNDVNNYSCALNSLASADVYLRNQANGSAFSYTGPASGNNNPNPAGEIDGRLANLYQSISGDFTFSPNPTWPTSNVPPCVTLAISTAGGQAAVGGSATLTFGPPAPQFSSTPLLFGAQQCTLSATDGTFVAPANVGTSGSVSTGTLIKSGTYSATLECMGGAGTTVSSFSTATVPVSSTPVLKTVTVIPATASVPAGTTQQFNASGTSTANTPIALGPVSWQTNNGVASITSSGLATCQQMGTSQITATSGGISGNATLTCQAPVLKTITVIPGSASIPAGTTQQFTANGTNTLNQPMTPSPLTWSANSTVVSITSGGLATCQTPGSATITAQSGNITGTASLTCQNAVPVAIQVTPATPSIATGTTQQFTATSQDSLGNFSNVTSTAAWVSSSPTVASINGNGLASCLQPGSTGITATKGGVSGGAQLTCNVVAGSVTLHANPTTTLINRDVELSWTSSNLSPAAVCAITSNSSDDPANETGLAPQGSLTITDAVPQKVTYTITCTGGQTVSSSVDVIYTLRTTYQYTGNRFPGADVSGHYSSNDRVIDSISVDVPFAPNLTNASVTSVPGFAMTMSDGEQTLTPQNSNSFTFVSTDSHGTITSWSLSNQTASTGISTQGDPGNSGSVDLGYLGPGPLCIAPTDCGAIARNEGKWTSTNITDLQVVYGTTTGPKSGQLFRLKIGGTDVAPTLEASTILAETPEPKACTGGSGVNAGAAITSLAWLANAAPNSYDVIASNGLVGDLFRLAGPSYQPSAGIVNASPNCWNTGPSQVAVAANFDGTSVVGVGHDVAHTQTPAVYYFPSSPAPAAPNFVLIDNVNADPTLTACAASDGVSTGAAGCVNSLVDSLVAPFTQGPIVSGDMLALVGDAYSGFGSKPIVLQIPKLALDRAKNFASNCPSSYGNTSGTPPACVAENNSGGRPVVTQADLPLQSGESPVSMDLEPLNGGLFIATNLGHIYHLDSTDSGYTNPTLWASGPPGFKTIRAGVWNDTLYLIATLQGGGGNQIVVFAGFPPDETGFGMSGQGVATAPVDGAVTGLAVRKGVAIGGPSN